jgi:hypothetical protein
MQERSVIHAARYAVRLRKPPPWLEHMWYSNIGLAMPVMHVECAHLSTRQQQDLNHHASSGGSSRHYGTTVVAAVAPGNSSSSSTDGGQACGSLMQHSETMDGRIIRVAATAVTAEARQDGMQHWAAAAATDIQV